MSDSMIEDVQKRMYEWANQKILTTTNVTAKEVEEITQQFWLTTIPECSKPLKQVELEGLFQQKVKDWCAKHKQ